MKVSMNKVLLYGRVVTLLLLSMVLAAILGLVLHVIMLVVGLP